MPDFVHLHVHSEYSLLDGLSRTKSVAARAKELNMPAVAITDHGTMFAAIEFHDACKEAGVKPIIGVESYLATRTMADRDGKLDRSPYHLLLLAENEIGYKNLLKISSTAQLEGFYQKPRVDKRYLESVSDGLIATTGCLTAEIPTLLVQGKTKQARDLVDWYRQIFKDRFYVELQEHGIPELTRINQDLISIAREFNLKLIATNDVHYVAQGDWFAQDVLLCVQTGALVNQSDRMKMDGRDYWFKSQDEMFQVWREIPEALTNTLEIAERCNVDLSFKGYHLPNFTVPAGYTPENYLRAICEQGFHQRYPNASHEKIERLNYELGVIHKMGFDTYFLIVWDLIDYAHKHGIWANARGSAAGSMVAYCLGITNLDPLEHNLIFERFLNPDRISMPDIDLDFPDDARQEMIDYTVAKYGKNNVAQIITFGKMLAKAALRDVGRAMDYPLSETDRVAKLIPIGPGQTIDGSLENVREFRELYENSDYIKKLIDNAKLLEGVTRNASTHAAGVIITDKPVIEYTPLHRPTRGDESGTPVTQYPMGDLEHIGLLKIDFLGLAHLSIVREACKLINARHGTNFDLNSIPVEDAKAFELMARGDVIGLFQLEGGGMKRVVTQMRPTKFDHIVATIALYRPGPMDYIPDYIARLHGQQKIEYRHPALEPILGETFGIMIYQEQIMRIARDLCGFTGGETDTLRKAVGKKNKEAILKHREKFVQGADKTGIISAEIAEKIFDDIEFFARYGFNKCLTAETHIVDAASGRVTTIGELYEAQSLIEIPTLEEDGRIAAREIAAVMLNEVKPVYRLRTRSGREIRATANHPFRVFAGWKNLEDLRVGELIAAPRFIPYTPSSNLRAHEIVVLATVLGEGNLCHPHSFYVYSKDEEQLADYVSHLECFENSRAVIDRSKSAASVYARREDVTRPSGAVEFIQRTSLHGKRAIEKFIPEVVFGLPLEQLAMFMGRLWSADGCIHPKTLSIYYATSSPEFARQVQHLLLRFGLQSTLHTKQFKYRGGLRVGFTINLLGGRAATQHFANTIGQYLVGHTRENLQQLNAAYERLEDSRDHGTVEIVPTAVRTLIRSEMSARGIGPKSFSRTTKIAEGLFYQDQRKRGYRRDTLAEIARALDSETLRAHAESDIFWDEIEGIEPDGAEETFDLTVPVTHNFIANDLIVHNSHAAVYGVLTCQTAYLKAHYTIEYMTALLSTDIGNTDKLAMFVAETRHLGIQVLPPDVRYSDMKFTIDDSQHAIRFGLLGVKNVGEGPIQAILNGRANEPFTSLDDFCTRVDLKQVNRRVLESLIKAGAFDAFGHRAQLLEAIDQMLSVSSSHHNASAAGQMSMFGGLLAADTFGELPKVKEIGNKTQLEWEKELMGVYFSQHPLLNLAASGKKHVGAYVGEISHESDGQQVTIGGIIKSVRQIVTKKGDAMAFLQIEDPQGAIEVVAFPRIFNDCRDVIHEDALVLARGKVQVREDKLAILADLIWNYPIETPKPEAVAQADRPIPGIFSNTPIIVPAPAPSVNEYVERVVDDWMPPAGDWEEEERGAESVERGERETRNEKLPVLNRVKEETKIEQSVMNEIAVAAVMAETQNETVDEEDWVKPSDDDFAEEPIAEKIETQTLTQSPSAPIQEKPMTELQSIDIPITDSLITATPMAAPTPVPEIKLGSGVPIPSKNGGNGNARPQHSAPAPRGNAVRDSGLPYLPQRSGGARRVRVRFLERTNDDALDTKRMREVVKLLRSAEGRDRFALIVPSQKSWVELDFPNFYTNIDQVMPKLMERVGDWGEVELG